MITLIVTSFAYCIKHLINIYLYSVLFIIVNTWIGLDFGLSRIYVQLLDKLFKLIEKNEKFFFHQTKSSAELKVGNETESKSKINGYTKQEVESFFTAKSPDHWNLLTSTLRPKGQNEDRQLTFLGKVLFTFGLFLRFGLLFPIRLLLLAYTLLQTIVVVVNLAYVLPANKFRDLYYNFCWRLTFRLFAQNFGCYFNYHGTHNCHQAGGVAVANHTGPIDIIALGEHIRYSFMGRRRNGLLGYLYSTLEVCGGNVWFDLSEKETIKERLRSRVHDPVSYPLVVFPEGTCTTTDCILRFRKGAFELGCSAYPIAIKYDLRYGNPFWNSKHIGFLGLCVKLFTNWSIVGDIYYLPPVNKKESESCIEFSLRVQGLIADQIGLKKVDLDGYTIKYGNCNNNNSEENDKSFQSSETIVETINQQSATIGSKNTFSHHANQSLGLGLNGELITRSY